MTLTTVLGSWIPNGNSCHGEYKEEKAFKLHSVSSEEKNVGRWKAPITRCILSSGEI